MKNLLRIALHGLGRRTARFARDTSGVMAVHILIFFFLMILVGGIAVDMMRFETKRVSVQNTMDRATLAAASLKQTLNPTSVVHDWFEKSGLSEELDTVDVQQAMNSRTVTAKATVNSPNHFMSMMDVPYLEALNVSQAEQRVTNVEIALVLDVSGSMYNTISRINNLKSAAKDFVDTVLENDTENKISITSVPYNGQVNLGPTLISKFNVNGGHAFPTSQPNGATGKSYCLNLPTNTYSSTTISRTTPVKQSPFGQAWATNMSTSTSYVAIVEPQWDTTRKLYTNLWCSPVAGNYVRMHNNNKTTLKSQIDGLVPVGATSIDLGMKWGTYLLDPTSRGITESMVTSGDIPAYFSTRPADYGDKETLKVIVLMTDGANFDQERFSDTYLGTTKSDIWRANDKYMSIFVASKVDASTSTKLCNSRPFYVPHLNAWHSRPWNGTAPSGTACYSTTATYTNTTRLSWNEVWSYAHTDWVAWQLYARALCTTTSCMNTTYAEWKNKFRSYVDWTNTHDNTPTMDANLNTICAQAKSKNILVYGIAFETDTRGANAIRNCASSPSSTYFFDVNGLEIKTAFALIASNLSQLRLTQ